MLSRDGKTFWMVVILVIVLGVQGIPPVEASTENLQTGVIRVAPNGAVSEPCGADWSNPCDMQFALLNSTSGNELWVKTGTYYPDEGAGQVNNDRNSTFHLVSGVALYGGFTGVETLREQRNSDPATNNTILSGDIDGIAGIDGNAFHVVTVINVPATTVLDGFTISGGNTMGGPQGYGAGMVIEGNRPTFENLIIKNNTATGGGGVFLLSPGNTVPEAEYSRPTFTNVKFINNNAAEGGGIYIQNASPVLNNVSFIGNIAETAAGGGVNSQTLTSSDAPSMPRLTNVVFSGNSAWGGAGLFNHNSDAVLVNVTFSNNIAHRRGGGMFNEFSNPSLTNVTFYGNISEESLGTSPWGGGGIMNVTSNPTLNNVTLSGNNSLNGSGTGGGDGIRNVENSSPVIRNSILWGDIDDEITSDGTGTTTIYDSVIQGASADPISNIITTNPNLIALGNNGGFTQTLAIGFGSSALDAGNTSTCATTDQRGYSRPNGNGCDIGAYEAYPLTVTADSQSMVYGNPEPTYTFQYSGFKDGDTSNVVDTPPTCGVSGVHSNAGTYSITCSGGSDNKYIFFSYVSGTLTVNKATPTISVSNSPIVYDGSSHTATISGSVPGTPSNILTGGSASQTNVGTYPVTANFIPTDTTNYNSLTNAPAGNFVINKATPSLSVTNSPVTYDGAPHAASVNASVPGSITNILTGGSASKTNAGSYAVTANFIPTDTANYNSLTNASAGNFVINKVTPTLSVTSSPVTYDGLSHSVTVIGSVAGTPSNILLGGSASQTNAGTYAVTANFIPTDTINYNSLTNASAGNYVINKATPTISVSNSPITYDGAPHAATIMGSVPGTPNNILTGGAVNQTNAGTYAVTANYVPTDTTNYNSLVNVSAGNFIINKATPTISVSNSPVIYNGSPQSALVTGSVPGTLTNILTGGSASQTNAGTYAVTVNFVPDDTANYNSLTNASVGNFIINKATPILSVTNSPILFDGLPHTAIVGSSVPGSISNILIGGSATKTSVGTYPVTANFTPTDSVNFKNLTGAAAGNFVISPDITPPDTQLNIRPASPSTATVTFTFSSTDGTATFECQLDGAGFSACATPVNFANLSNGLHTFDVRARDPYGNIDATPASHTWMVAVSTSSAMHSTIVVPSSITYQSGSTSGSTPSLASFEQDGTDDNVGTYVKFQTLGSVHVGQKSFYIPSDIQADLISSMLLQVNFNAPDASTQLWTWSIYDWNSGLWIRLGDTIGSTANQWNSMVFPVRNMRSYISAGHEIRIRLQSNNANGDLKLDYEALHLTYRPVAVTVPLPAPTVPANRPGIASGPGRMVR